MIPHDTVRFTRVEKDMSDNELVPLQIRFPKDLLQRLDKYRLSLTIQPSRSQMIRYFVETGLTDKVKNERIRNDE